MSVIRITAEGERPVVTGSALPVADALADALAEAKSGPIVVMVHGFKYAPGVGRHCPHETIFSLTPDHRHVDRRIVSWPRHLGLGRPDGGLAVSFGWAARGSIWKAYDGAATAGLALSRLLAELRRLAPHRPIHAVGHSLGARVILSAMRASKPGALDWAVLLAPAEFTAAADAALASPAGRTAKVLTVTSRENDVFDALMELFVTAPVRGDRMLGHRGLDAPNALTLQIDHDETLASLRRAGHRLARSARRVCHWSPYLRPGAFPLYRAILTGELPFERLAQLLTGPADPRWTRLWPSFGPVRRAERALWTRPDAPVSTS